MIEVVISGTVTKAPTERYPVGGKAFAFLTVKANESPATGKPAALPQFFTVVAYGSTMSDVTPLKEGDAVAIYGSLHPGTNTGSAFHSFLVVAQQVVLSGNHKITMSARISAKNPAPSPAPRPAGVAPTTTAPSQQVGFYEVYEPGSMY